MTKLIAEIGINHAGNINLLKDLILKAKESGSDAVKFQYRRNLKNFFTDTLEMGSTLIKDELSDVFLKDKDFLTAFRYAKKLGLQVGVSFFRTNDIKHLCKKFSFDFIKIPSAECLNIDLIKSAQNLCQIVMISTGGTSGKDIEFMSKKIKLRKNDVVFYCVSNYPAALDVIHFNFLKQLKNKFKCNIGYSSHDDYWEVCLASAYAGVDYIERHICINKEAEGLDISSSSNPVEFNRLSLILKNQKWTTKVNLHKKLPNQGEIQNIKDLGSGYYFLKNLNNGDIITPDCIETKSPCRGIKAGTYNLIGKRVSRVVNSGDPVLNDDLNLKKSKNSRNSNFDFTHKYNIGLPIRFNDINIIMKKFNLPYYEFHMSYNDILCIDNLDNSFWQKIKESNSGFSVHLPDYISQKHLIDPLSAKDSDVYNKSHFLIKSCIDFALKLEDLTMKTCPLIGSFSEVHGSKKETYLLLAEYIKKIARNNGCILPQFLPKRAWYFGGAVEIDLFCHIEDKKFFSYFPNGICLDTAHVIMACNSAKGNKQEWFSQLMPIAGHVHIADAKGIDGEGINFGQGELDPNILYSFSSDLRIIIEQWEGHLNNFRGFENALLYLERMK